MKKFVILTVLAVSTLVAPAQDLFGPGAGSTGSFNSALMKLFGKNNAFTATADAKISQGKGEPTTMSMKMAFLDGKIRTDMDMATMKSPDLPPSAIDQMKQMGMDKMSSIVEPAKKTMTIIYPSMNAYAEMPIPDQAKPDEKEPKIEKKEIGKETIDGHPCVKNKVTITDSTGKAQEFTVWSATDLQDFPVKSEFNESGSTITVLYKDIKLGKPDAAQFQPPAGYKKYNNMQEMMMEKMMEAQRGRK